MEIVINIIRRNIYLYILFINIYKKYTYLFSFIEKNNYLFLKSKKINHILDIGSNNFQISKIILSINKNIKITCFDANILLKNNIQKNICYNNFGLSSSNSKKYFHIPFYKNYMLDSMSSTNKSFALSSLEAHKDKVVFKSFLLEFQKLDNKQYNFQFMKIDAEGSELDILFGAQENIINNNPIILVERNSEFFKVNKLLSKINYKTYFYNYRLNKFIHQNEINEKNIFFLNEKSFKYLKK